MAASSRPLAMRRLAGAGERRAHRYAAAQFRAGDTWQRLDRRTLNRAPAIAAGVARAPATAQA